MVGRRREVGEVRVRDWGAVDRGLCYVLEKDGGKCRFVALWWDLGEFFSRIPRMDGGGWVYRREYLLEGGGV